MIAPGPHGCWWLFYFFGGGGGGVCYFSLGGIQKNKKKRVSVQKELAMTAGPGCTTTSQPIYRPRWQKVRQSTPDALTSQIGWQLVPCKLTFCGTVTVLIVSVTVASWHPTGGQPWAGGRSVWDVVVQPGPWRLPCGRCPGSKLYYAIKAEGFQTVFICPLPSCEVLSWRRRKWQSRLMNEHRLCQCLLVLLRTSANDSSSSLSD